MSTDQNPSTPSAITTGDWFTLFLRVLGIWQLITGVEEFITYRVGLSQINPYASVEGFMTHNLAYLLIGLWLLLGAPAIARFFYPAKSGGPEKPGKPN